MKLILSTLALGTAAAAPMMQESGADAPKGEPLAIHTSQEKRQELYTAALAPKVWKVELATTNDAAQDDDQKELEKAAKELESELARLRAELEAMRGNLVKERGQAARLRGRTAREAGDLGESRRAAIEISREAAAEARQMAQEARVEALEAAKGARLEALNIANEARQSARAQAKNLRGLAKGVKGRNIIRLQNDQDNAKTIVRYLNPNGSPLETEGDAIIEYLSEGEGDGQVFVLKAGETIPMPASKNVQEWAIAKVNAGDLKGGKTPVGLKWKIDSDANGVGTTPKGIAWITDVEVEHDAHDHDGHEHGHDDHGSHGMHGGDGSTINIHVEKGDVHIHASGSSIHTSGAHGQAPKSDLFGSLISTDKKGRKGFFSMKNKGGQSGPGIFGGKAIRKIVVNGEEIDSSEIEMPDGFFFDSDSDGDNNFSFGFAGELDLEDITEEIAEAMEGELPEMIFEDITEGLEGLQGRIAVKHLGGIAGLEGLEGLAELKNLKGLEGLVELKSLEGLEGLVELKNLKGGNFLFGNAKGDGLERFEVKTTTQDGEAQIRVFVNGEEIPNFGESEESEECIEEECEEEKEEGDDRFVWLRGPKAPPAPTAVSGAWLPGTVAGPSAPFPAPADELLLAVRPTFPRAMAPAAARAVADAELAGLAREIREELRAMRAEIRELRAEVMRAPRAHAPDPTARGSRRARGQQAPAPVRRR